MQRSGVRRAWLLAGLVLLLAAASPPPAGALTFYVSDWDNNLVERYVDGVATTFVSSGSGGLNRADGLAFGPDQTGDGVRELFVSSFNSSSLMRYDGATGAPLPSGVNSGAVFATGITEPRDIAVDALGRVYVAASSSQNSVFRYDGLTGAPLPSGSNPGALFALLPSGSGPVGLALGDAGDIYVAARDTFKIERYGLDGTHLGTPVSGLNSFIRGLAFGAGSLYVQVDGPSERVVQRYSTGGALLATTPAGALPRAYAVRYGADGVVYIGDDAPFRIKAFDATTLAEIGTPIPPGSPIASAGFFEVLTASTVPEPGLAALALLSAGALASRRRFSSRATAPGSRRPRG